MAQTRPKTTTDGAKAIARTITDHGRRIRDLELHPDPVGGGGFTPIGATIYDGYDSTVGTSYPYLRWSKGDFGNSEFDDYSDFGINTGDAMSPDFDDTTQGVFCPYTWYDTSGFVQTPGVFTIPEGQDGVYVLSAHTQFFPSNGYLDMAEMRISTPPAPELPPSGTVIAGIVEQQHMQSVNDDQYQRTAHLTMSTPVALVAGAEIKMHLHFYMHAVGALTDGTFLVTIQRPNLLSPPPYEASGLEKGPRFGTRFSIQKVMDNPVSFYGH